MEREKIKELFEALDNKQPWQAFSDVKKSLQAPKSHAVYVIRRKEDKRVVQVGRTVRSEKGLKRRLKDHLNGRSSFAKGFLKPDNLNLRQDFEFQYVEVFDDRERALLEHYATAMYCPEYLPLGVTK